MKRLGIFSCIILSMLCFTSCNDTNKAQPSDAPLDAYTIAYDKDTVVDDDLLREQPYIMPEDYNTRCVAVLRCRSEQMEMTQYIVKSGDVLNIDAALGEQLIISQYANRTVLYTWHIKNEDSLNYLELMNRTWMNVPLPKSEWNKAGASLDRQNFYFRTVKKGLDTIEMRYEHQEETRSEVFDIKICVNVVNPME